MPHKSTAYIKINPKFSNFVGSAGGRVVWVSYMVRKFSGIGGMVCMHD